MSSPAVHRRSRRIPRHIPRSLAGGPPGGPVQASTAAAMVGAGTPTTRGSLAANVAHELSLWVPTAAAPFDQTKAAHLMRRAGFGATPEELETLVTIGVHRTVDLLVIPSNWGIQEFGSVLLPNGELLNIHYRLADQQAQWLHEAAHTHFPLKEKMALFWHDHFSVGANQALVFPMLIPHVNIFRRHGLGRFRDILVAISQDPAMLYWLDNRINGQRGRINENYGREVIELYTMGETAPYTQTDVYEASRCFAGWSLNYYNQYLYNTAFARGVTGVKNVLGTQIHSPSNQELEGYMLIDLLLSRKETSRYVAGKIFSYFVAERPESDLLEQQLWDGIVDELANRWRSSGYDLRMLMSTILRCNYFFGPRAVRRLVKNPMEYVVGTIRNLGNPYIGRYTVVAARLSAMGLPLFRYEDPSGLDDGVSWIDSQSVINRSNFANELTQVSTTAGFRSQWDPAVEMQRKKLTTATQIVDHFLAILVDGDANPAIRKGLRDYMDYYDASPAPQYNPYDGLPANSQYRATKVRGLVQLIMALPEYHIN